MSDKIINVSIPLDDDGFLNVECPFRSEQFKISGGDYEDEDIFQLFCPYCGQVDEKIAFVLTEDLQEHITTLAENMAIDMINKSFDDIEKSIRGSKNISFKKGQDLKKENPKKLIALNNLHEYEMKCCDKHIKVISENMGVFCPFCGVK